VGAGLFFFDIHGLMPEATKCRPLRGLKNKKYIEKGATSFLILDYFEKNIEKYNKLIFLALY